MALALYIFSLAAASGACAALARKLLQGLGYVPTVEAGIWLTAGLAGAFAAVQLGYFAFMRLTAPARGPAPLFFETISNAAVVAFLPYLAGFSVLPYVKAAIGGQGAELVDKVTEKLSAGVLEPVALAGLFLAVHVAFKLIAFFSATESRPAGRFGALGWGGAAAAAGFAGMLALQQWAAALDAARNVPLGEPKAVAIGGAYCFARPVPMGAYLDVPLEGRAGQQVMLYWAVAREYTVPPQELHVTVAVDAEEPYQRPLKLAAGGWTPFRPLSGPVPEGAKLLRVSWDEGKSAPVALKWGLRPPPSATDKAWAAGPYFSAPPHADEAPSIIVVSMDGVATARLKSQGYFRDTMPVLENLARSALFFPMGITPSPEAPAASMSLLTGLSPLAHGHLGRQAGPLPAGVKTLPEILREQGYTTAAFTEADWLSGSDLDYGTAFDRGFDFFDPTTPMAASSRGSLPGAPAPPEHAGSAVTLAKAAAWAEANADGRFFLFVRLREAGAPALLDRYGEGFVSDRAQPKRDEVYDTALLNVDKALPAFMDRLKARGLMDKAVVVFTSSFGIDSNRPASAGAELSDATTVVPILLMQPGKSGAHRGAIAGVEHLAPTLLRMVKGAEGAIPGPDLRDYTSGNECISMLGDPLVFSLRNRRWRFTWDSGLDPATRAPKSGEAALALINIEQSRARKAIVDELARYPEEVTRCRAAIVAYLEKLPPP